MSKSGGNDSQSSIRSITRGASVYLTGYGFGTILNFLFNLLMTRGLGIGLYGIYSYADALVRIIYTFSNLGTNKSILRFIPQYEDDTQRQNHILALSYLTSFIVSFVMGVVLYILAPAINDITLRDPLLVDVFRVFALMIPIQTLSRSVASVFQSLELPEYQIFILRIAFPVSRLVPAAIALAVGAALVGVTAATVVGGVIVFFVAFRLFLSRTSFHPTLARSRDEYVEFYNFSIPLAFYEAGRLLYRQIDLLMIGAFIAAGSAVGTYRVATILAGFLSLPLTGFNQLFPPIASRLYANDQREELDDVYTRITRWVFTISLFPAVGAVVYRGEALAMFGDIPAVGETILILFVVGELTNAAVGPSGYLLMMTDHQYLSFLNEWALGLFNIILNYVFIQQFGLVGAALATAGILAVINVVRVIEVWYTEQLFPYSLQFVKPLLASFAAGIVMLGMRAFLSGFALFFVGGVIGAVVFVLALLALGIEDEDKEFFAESVPGFGD